MKSTAKSLSDLRFNAANGIRCVSRTFPNWNRKVTSGSNSMVVDGDFVIYLSYSSSFYCSWNDIHIILVVEFAKRLIDRRGWVVYK